MTPIYSHSFRWMYLHLDEYLLRKLTDGLPLVVTMLVGIAAAHCWNWLQSRRQELHRLKEHKSEGA